MRLEELIGKRAADFVAAAKKERLRVLEKDRNPLPLDYFKAGILLGSLNLLKKYEPGYYAAAMREIGRKGRMAELDWKDIERKATAYARQTVTPSAP
jgi:hypothetical protein